MKKLIIIEKCKDLLKNVQSTKDITLLKVAQECNIGKSTIYEYFSTKEELLQETLIYIFNELIDKISTLDFTDLNYQQSFIKLIKFFFVCHQETFNIFIQVIMDKGFEWNIDQAFIENHQHILREAYIKKVQEVILKGRAENLLIIKDYDEYDKMFIEGTLVGNIMNCKNNFKNFENKDYYLKFFEFFTNVMNNL